MDGIRAGAGRYARRACAKNEASAAWQEITRVTKTSHGGRQIDDNLLSMMARQCRLSSKDFALLLDCPMDRDSYERQLVEKDFLEAP